MVVDGLTTEIRLAAASLAAFPTRLFQTEAALLDKPIGPHAIESARKELLAEAQPIDDIRSTADYRKQVAANLLEEFLLSLCSGEPLK
jgi:CO/xanthine dehydrogenase FAD-binding subunit